MNRLNRPGFLGGSTLFTKIPYAETREEAERQKRTFQTWCTKRGYAGARWNATGNGW